MYMRVIIVSAIVVVVAAAVSKGMSMRRELPFQEIMPIDEAVAIVNTQNWYINSLQITLRTGSGLIRKKYNDLGFCIFKDLNNGKKYTVEINRTDIKGMLLYKKMKKQVIPKSIKSKYMVLIGASVGKSWNFPQLVDRYNLGEDIKLGFRCKYDFDKSAELNALFKAPFKVSGIIIKECSAYFPRELKSSEEKIKSWVSDVRSQGINPILATVVPITKERDKKSPGKFESILAFNDFIRSYAAGENLRVLDLEKAVRISDTDRHLRDEFAKPDGTHLVKNAYTEALDKIALQLIKELTN